MKFAILEDDLIIFYRYYLVKWVRIVSVTDEKKSKKILEKCEMSFCSSENKNWTFRGSFGNFHDFFLVFVGIVYLYTSINEY